MDTAREILRFHVFHVYSASSTSNTVRGVQPMSSTDSTLPRKQMKTAVAFNIPVGKGLRSARTLEFHGVKERERSRLNALCSM